MAALLALSPLLVGLLAIYALGIIYFAFVEPVLARWICRHLGHAPGWPDMDICDRCGADLPRKGDKTYGL